MAPKSKLAVVRISEILIQERDHYRFRFLITGKDRNFDDLKITLESNLHDIQTISLGTVGKGKTSTPIDRQLVFNGEMFRLARLLGESHTGKLMEESFDDEWLDLPKKHFTTTRHLTS